MSTDSRQCKRCNVIGTSGSGKTTCSGKLAETLAIPHVQMDAIFWGPNWYWPSDDEFFPRVQRALDQDAWVLDGHSTRTIPLKWAKVDWVMWLDDPFLTTMRQAVGRALSRSISGKELWEGTGNRETFRTSFLRKDSIVLYAMQSYAKARRRITGLMTAPQCADIRCVRLASPKVADAFLASLRVPA
ncbi:MAG: adenylate kinase [Candidatus Tectomicrobia bacterium]